MLEKISIPSKAKVRIEWKDFPHNFSKEDKKNIRNQFAKKYNIDPSAVTIIEFPIRLNKEGKKVAWTDGIIENVLTVDNQRKLMKEWLENENITDVDWDRIVKIDDEINSLVQNTINENNCGVVWNPIELGVSNLLSFGDDTIIKWDQYKGLTLITSDPPNMGGKTNLSVDSMMFILFGSTTKTDKNEEMFNLYSNKDELSGYLIFDVNEQKYKIERILTRKEKKSGGYTVTNKVHYFKLNDDGSETELVEESENLEGEQARETNKIIKEIIGSKDDFETIICATAKTLDNIIDSKVIGASDRGKLLNKFIGLEIFEKKERTHRDKKNAFEKAMKSNVYNKTTLEKEIETNIFTIGVNTKTITEKEEQIVVNDKNIKEYTNFKEKLLQSKFQIDADILKLDSTSLQTKIETITKSGITKKEEQGIKTKEFELLKDVKFDKEAYEKVIQEDKDLCVEKSNLETENRNLKTENEGLEKAKVCPTCKRPMEGVNNEPKILENNNKINKNLIRIKEIELELSKIKLRKDALDIERDKITKRDQLELAISKLDVDLANLRADLVSEKEKQKKYNENKENIDKNNKIDQDLEFYTTKINTEVSFKNILIGDIERLKTENINLLKINEKNKGIIDEIMVEQDNLKYLNLYLSLIESKRGIGKLVLKNTLPVINYTLNEMLGEDVCDFTVELDLNSSNEVEIYMVRGETYTKVRGSSGFESFAIALALRVVFSRLSTLPKPNFLILDEILGGKVAAENLDKVQLVIDKIKKYYQTIFFITHDERTKDWADNIITIKKLNNISYLDK